MDEPLFEGEDDYLDMLLGDAPNEDDEDTPYIDLPDSNIGFISIIIYMSFVQLPTIDRYRSTNSLYKCSTGFISTIMTLKRFKAILCFIQINGDPDKDDKLTRVLPLLNHIQTASQMYFQPNNAISVDERIVAS